MHPWMPTHLRRALPRAPHDHAAVEDTWDRNVARVRWHAWRNVDRVKAEAGVTASNDGRHRDEPSRDAVPLDAPEPEDGLD